MKEISKTQIISGAELETGVASIHSRFDDYLSKEDYIEDKVKFAVKELEKENKYRIREDEVNKRLDYTLQEILSIKNYNNCCILLIKYAIAFSLQGTITLSAAALTLSGALPTAKPKSVILTRGISFSKSPMPITVCIFLR